MIIHGTINYGKYVGKKIGALTILSMYVRVVFWGFGCCKPIHWYVVKCDCGRVFTIRARSVLFYGREACLYCTGKHHNREKYH